MKILPKTFEFKGLTDWVHIFSSGDHVPGNVGTPMNFSHADLDEMVATHDPVHPAKHVITHKELFSPFGYGNAAEFKREGDHLYVRSDKIEPQFEALVENDRLSERSIRLKKNDDGKWKVDHIAWLGAEPPAVEGLEPVEFSGATDGFFDFSVTNDQARELGWGVKSIARMIRRWRERHIEKHGVDDADQVIPEYEIDSLSNIGDSLLRDNSDSPQFSADSDQSKETPPQNPKDNSTNEGGATVTGVTQEAHDAALKAEKEKTVAALAKAKKLQDDAKKAEFSAFVEGLDCDPAKKTGMVDFMMSIASVKSYDFSAGDGKETVSVNPVDQFKEFAKGLGSSVSTKGLDFSDSDGVDMTDANAIAAKAVEFQAAEQQAGRTITVTAAVAHVQKQQGGVTHDAAY